jgi:hypothetical protein
MLSFVPTLPALSAPWQKKPPVNCNNNGGPTGPTTIFQERIRVLLHGKAVHRAQVDLLFQDSPTSARRVFTNVHGYATASVLEGVWHVVVHYKGRQAVRDIEFKEDAPTTRIELSSK